MYCKNCNNKLPEGASFCGSCGSAVPDSENREGPVGFSLKIQDPSYAAYKKKSSLWSFVFAGFLFLAAAVGFPLYANKSGDIGWPESLYYGLGIGGMFVIIALAQTLRRKFDKTWDGEVINKDKYKLNERGDGFVHCHDVYILKIKKESGGIKKHRWKDSPGIFDYYNIGDRVRHHKGFYYYEKYDKSKDDRIMCAACNSFVDMGKDFCPRCKCPLLK